MAQLTGSFQVDGNIIAESFTGSVQGTATTASHALSVPFNTISDLPDNLVSASSQITLTDTIGNISGSRVIGDIAASSVDYDNVNNKPTLISSSAQVDLASATGTAANATTASYVSASDIDGEVYRAERARRIEVGSYGSYSELTDIPFVTGDYGENIKRISADGILQWHAGTNHLTVPGVNATTLTGSLDWDQLENVPDGIMSSSDGVIPDGTVSSSAQTIANLNSTGIISGSSQITSITIKEQNANNYYPVLFANTSNPSGDFQGQTAYSQIPGGTERIRFNPGTGQLELGNLLGSGSIYAYGMITGDEFTAGTAFNGQFVNFQRKVVIPDLPSTGQDSFMTLSATSSKANYQIQFENGLMFDLMWSYKGGGYGNQWTRVLTEQNIASGSATLTQVWVNGLVTGSTAEFESLTGSLSWNSLEDIPDGIMSSSDGIVPDGTISSSAQVDYEEIQNAPFSSSNPVSPILHPTIGSTDRGHVAIGEGVLEAGVSASNISYGIVAIGQNATGGLNAGILGSDNVVIGRKAAWNGGNLIEGCTNLSVVVGAYSNCNSSGTENVTVGAQSFTSASGHSNTTIGTWAGNGHGLTGNANTMIGHQAGGSDAFGVGIQGGSCRNTLLGAGTSLRNGCCNVLIGYGAGSYTDFNNKLYIENGGSSPLIEGDFSTNYVKINDVLELNQSNPLPSGGVGQLAVSASNLYFHNGSNWSQIN